MYKSKFKFFKRPRAPFEKTVEHYVNIDDVVVGTMAEDSYESYYLFGMRISRKETHARPKITDILYLVETTDKVFKAKKKIGFDRTSN